MQSLLRKLLRPLALTTLTLCSTAFSQLSHASHLTLERIFSAPALAGEAIRQVRYAPDHQHISYLKARADAHQHYDLWWYDSKTQTHKRILKSEQLNASSGELSEVEKARRERLRISAEGLVDYAWHPDSQQVLVTVAGDLYLFNVASGNSQRLTQTEAYETDAKLSPKGHYVSFIREQNLYLIDLANGQERALTDAGGGAISYAMAEFVAQEEIDRMSGYWWAPDEQHIALTRIDETPVQEITRSEIYADEVRLIEQRYPAAGSANVDIDLGIMNLSSGDTQWLGLAHLGDGYLARVNWVPDSQRLLYQWQNRSQTELTLYLHPLGSEQDQALLKETSTHWLNLNDDLRFLNDNNHFVWASSRSGYKHLYLYRLDGKLIRQLTAGEWMVDKLEHIDETLGVIYFTSRAKSPLESHLYRSSLTTTNPRNPTQLSQREGMHNVTFSGDGQSYVDVFSSPQQPPQVSMHGPTGERINWILENAVGANHPLADYLGQWRYPSFGSIKADDGKTLYFKITRPANFDKQKQYPAIVYSYGGPGAQRVTKSWGDYFTQYLAQQGFVVFTLDNRGTANRGNDFEQVIFKQLGQAEVADQVAGVKYLRSLDYVDDQRIGFYGHSYGGYLALMNIFKAPEYFQAAVAGAPVTDWRLYDTHYTERYMGMPNDGDNYEKASVFPYVKGLQGDLLIYHGMADDNVLFSHSTKLFKVLQDNRQRFEMMTYPGKKHSLNGRATKIHLYRTITEFFQRHLGV
ncbi:S9 family peptidase [Idiomarina xiamenensis]|uniref:Dipeptidyl peptidase IV n=1 Tax=Idiomarina xiamenensis 10-D-4 TaxID=740709 RepID=K2L1X3_9GAMM|nr:S9 family peptidase [Idiomarina xiamenensis]EKE83855.1 dipeptidyl peptidase IV [Idiomarina xiamenensis 10-D-4]